MSLALSVIHVIEAQFFDHYPFDIDKSVMQVVIIFLTRELGHQVVRVVRMLRAGVVVGDNAVIGINKDNIGLGGA